MTELKTARLSLRQWDEDDLERFAALNADPETMRYFTATLTREQSDAMARGLASVIEQRGWGLWAAEVIGGPRFIGLVGLNEPTFEAHFTPAVEVGWRLARAYWGHGYATEAAAAVIEFGCRDLGLEEIVAMVASGNTRSRRVAERLGMARDPVDDFDHPRVPD